MISYRNVFGVLGIIFFIFAGLMLIPALVDLCQFQNSGLYFVTGALFCCFVGGMLYFSFNYEKDVYLSSSEKVLVILLSWLFLPCVAALPMIISPIQVSPLDSIFDTVSAMTTTGANIITDYQGFSDGFLLWRGVLQLLGGIGFIISCLHVFSHFRLSEATDDNRQSNVSLLQQLKTITIIYCALILLASLVLIVTGSTAINAFSISCSAISSGGLVSENIPTAAYWIVALLMFISGCSITTLKSCTVVGIKTLINKQLQYYASVIVLFSLLLTVYIYRSIFFDLDLVQSLGKAFFTVTSAVSTTCFATDSHFGKFIDSVLYILNFCGGCSASCTGGIKIFRLVMLFAIIKSYLTKLVRPNVVSMPVYFGKRIDERNIAALLAFFICYIVLALIVALILTADVEFGKAFNAAITTLNNGNIFFELHKALPTELAVLSPVSKCSLIFAMIAGRVEYVAFFMVIIRAFWKR